MNLERLVCGHLYLTPMITMFINPSNVPSCDVMVTAFVKVCMVLTFLLLPSRVE